MRKRWKVGACFLGFLSYKTEVNAEETFEDELKAVGTLGGVVEKLTNADQQLHYVGKLAAKTGTPTRLIYAFQDGRERMSQSGEMTSNDLAMTLIDHGLLPGGPMFKALAYGLTHPGDIIEYAASTYEFLNPYANAEARKADGQRVMRQQLEEYQRANPHAIVDVDRELVGLQEGISETDAGPAFYSDPAIEELFDRKGQPACGSLEHYEKIGEGGCADTGLTMGGDDKPMKWRLTSSSIPGQEAFSADACLPLRSSALGFGQEYASLFLQGVCSVSQASGDGNFAEITLACDGGNRRLKTQKYADGSMNLIEVETDSVGNRWEYLFKFVMCEQSGLRP